MENRVNNIYLKEREGLVGTLSEYVLCCLYKTWPTTVDQRNIIVQAAIDTFREQMAYYYQAAAFEHKKNPVMEALNVDFGTLEADFIESLDLVIADFRKMLETQKPPFDQASYPPPGSPVY
jgi:hypothetical protein